MDEVIRRTVTSAGSAALNRLFRIFAHGSRQVRIDFTRIIGQDQDYFSDAFDPISRFLSEEQAAAFKAFSSVTILTRVLWSLAPSRLIDNPNPNFEKLAHDSLISRFGQYDGIDESTKLLTVIFKRIRQYSHTGRTTVASLDLKSTKHASIFKNQANRCNHCLYEFGTELYRYYAEDDEGVVSTHYEPKDDELILNKTFRRPELDHIVPLILGGDNHENWQILCKSCNLGKSDMINYMSSYSAHHANRYSQLIDLTPGKRYSIIAESRQWIVSPIPGDNKFFRIFKLKDSGLIGSDNLMARYC